MQFVVIHFKFILENECTHPPHISNGIKEIPRSGKFPVGNFVTYSCLPGYTLLGENKIRCIELIPNFSTWQRPLPQCLNPSQYSQYCLKLHKQRVSINGRFTCDYIKGIFFI